MGFTEYMSTNAHHFSCLNLLGSLGSRNKECAYACLDSQGPLPTLCKEGEAQKKGRGKPLGRPVSTRKNHEERHTHVKRPDAE